MLSELFLALALFADPPAQPAPSPPAPVQAGFIVSIPKVMSGAPGELLPIAAESGAALISWTSSPGLRVVNDDPPDAAGKSKLLHAKASGVYFVVAMIPTDKGGVRSSVCVVTIGKPLPPVPPGPIDPPDVAPIPVPGFRVLIVYETGDLPKYPKGQLAVLYGKEVRELMSVKAAKGDDGKTPEWRIWDKDVDTSGESKLWQDAMKRPRGKLPTILISNGTTGYEGPLPDTIEATVALLKKYGG